MYRIDPGGNFFVLPFKGSDIGRSLYGGLTQASDGYLYGATYWGGASGVGVIYRVDTAAAEVTTVHSFAAAPPSGQQSFASLTLARDGFLYGTTVGGGAAGAGAVFRFDPATNTVSTINRSRPSPRAATPRSRR